MNCIDRDVITPKNFTFDNPLSIQHINKNTLVDNEGRSYKSFKTTLTPRWIVLWVELSLGYIFLLLTAAFLIKTRHLNFILPLTIPCGALVFGCAQAYIQLFFHEAAHGNLAKNRGTNDLLANCLIGIFLGQNIKSYRLIHFAHHRYLGTPDDTERTYFDPLNIRFLVESLFGIRILKVLIARKNMPISEQERNTIFNSQLFAGLSLHLTLLALALWFNQWPLAIAWILGMIIVFPFFAALRQGLEHRDVQAISDINYNKVPHGQVHRLFGDGLCARIIGGAGFNRHLLHHWEPQISYTQLYALENFLLNTNAANIIRSHQTTYFLTFLQLIKAK